MPPQRIATVDARRLFDEYWKTKEAIRKLQSDMSDDAAVLDKLMVDYRKLNDELTSLTNAANDPGISADEQRKRKTAAEAKLAEVREFETVANGTRNSLLQRTEERKRRYRAEFLSDITNSIASMAKAGNYDFVFDISGESGNNQTPLFLFSTGKFDLTGPVLEALNKDAPRESALNPAPVMPATHPPSTNLLPRFPAAAPTNVPARGAPAGGSR